MLLERDGGCCLLWYGRELTVNYAIRERWWLFTMVWEGAGCCLLWYGRELTVVYYGVGELSQSKGAWF